MWIPSFRYPVTSGTVLTLTTPMRHWARRQSTAGGSRVAAAGYPNVGFHTIRRDYLLDIVVRFAESEQTAVENMIAWMQDNRATAFDFWPDVAVAGTFYPSYLISLVQGEDISPPRDSTEPSTLELAMTLQRTTKAQWPLEWYINA